jgi:hypothetical protein
MVNYLDISHLSAKRNCGFWLEAGLILLMR